MGVQGFDDKIEKERDRAFKEWLHLLFKLQFNDFTEWTFLGDFFTLGIDCKLQYVYIRTGFENIVIVWSLIKA